MNGAALTDEQLRDMASAQLAFTLAAKKHFILRHGRDLPEKMPERDRFKDDSLYVFSFSDGLVIGELRGRTLHAWSEEGAKRYSDFQATLDLDA